MAAVGIKTSVLVIPNPEWSMTSNDFAHVPANLSFTQDLPSNIRTLSTNSISQGDTATGLLYVPDLEPQDPCVNSSSPYVPANVTRQANLPNKDYDLIAIAPWISAECTLAYLASARSDPIHAFLFFPPDHRTAEPPLPNDPMWNLNDGGDWKAINRFPVYAIPGQVGWTLMNQSSHYSGNMTDVEFGQVLSEMHDSRDYVRLYTEISTGSRNTLPSLWVFLVIVLAVLLVIIFITSFTMRWIQKKRRQALRRRVAEGEVDLEALGIKRVTVPKDVLEKLPLFVYVAPGAGRDGCAEDPPNAPVQVPTSESALPDPLPDGSPRINHPTPSPSLPRRVLPFSQSTCPICLDDFTSAVTTVRELPCSHIFHPECVDDFFQTTSSLCPLCKKSILPAGHCPPTVTNTMVRRERMIRRMRERVVVPDMGMGLDGETGSGVDYSQVLTPPTVMMRVTAGLSGLTSLRFPYRRRQSSASPRSRVNRTNAANTRTRMDPDEDVATT
ncbi:MAG: hypothetical protein M1838_004374 [Thelocarpon superellum]|nr:MAG: hypothetical protein M1838_004374 [Thelocarpon superellum]